MKRPVGFDAPQARQEPLPAAARRRASAPEAPRSRDGRTAAERASAERAAAERDQAERAAPERAVPGAARRDAARERAEIRAWKRANAGDTRRFTRRRRMRRRVLLIAAATLVLFVATPVLLSVSPVFAVRQVRVLGADSSFTAQLRAALATEIGTPIALVSDASVHRAVASIPQVQSYSIERLPPSTLEVRVVPRTAVALVRSGSAYRVVDAAGVTLRTTNARQAGLPLVSASTAGFPAAAAVIEALPSSLVRRVAAVRATTANDVRLTLTDGRRVVWGSADDSAAKALALKAALVRAAKGATTIDVSAPGLVTTR